MSTLDKIDQKILNSLQLNGRLSNGELAEEIGLSASQCSRRRTRLETSATRYWRMMRSVMLRLR